MIPRAVPAKSVARTAAVLVLVAVTEVAGAQGTGLPGDGLDALLRASRHAWFAQLNAALEHSVSNAANPWRDPGSGASGMIVVFPASSATGRPCRGFTVSIVAPGQGGGGPVRDGGLEAQLSGQRCREPSGEWTIAGEADAVTVAHRDPPPPVLAQAPRGADNPYLSALQTNLGRLAYYLGPADGVSSAAFVTALLEFERDESIPPEGEASRRAWEQSAAAIARIPPPAEAGACEGSAPVGGVLACGRVR